MKIVFIVYSDVLYGPSSSVMDLLQELGIDYFTRWDRVKGKGHGTEAHLGTATKPVENTTLMIAFDDEALVDRLFAGLTKLNETVGRTDERIRAFQVPLERMV